MNYWIELYWPVRQPRTRNEDHFMWISSKKLGRHQKSIKAGDTVFFYETGVHQIDKRNTGAKCLFAAATVTDEFLNVTNAARRDHGDYWIKWRRTKIISWVPPQFGIPRLRMNELLGFSSHAIRGGPFRINSPTAGPALLKLLKELEASSP